MTKTIIILNGPPRCGKDTLADYIREHLGYIKVEFKAALRSDVCSVFDTDLQTISDMERFKDTPSTHFIHPETGQCLALRQALIYTSEEIMKRTYGKDYYGKRVAQLLKELPYEMFICSDGGFESEIPPIVEAGIRVRIIRLHRDGHTFEGDSRSYIDTDFVLGLSEAGHDISVHDFHNNAPYAQYVADGMALVLSL